MVNIFLFLTFLLSLVVSVPSLAADRRPLISGLKSPVGMVYNRQGQLYVAEWGAGRVSKFDADGNRSTVTEAVPSPSGLAFDDQGTLYIASYRDGGIYALPSGGKIRRVASGFSAPAAILWTRDKYLLVANRNAGELVKVDFKGNKEVLHHNLATPVGLAQTDDGTIFVSCFNGGIDMIKPSGQRSTIYQGLKTPGVGLAADGSDVLAVDYGGTTVTRISQQGQAAPLIDDLSSPVGLAITPNGKLLVGTWGDDSLYIFDYK